MIMVNIDENVSDEHFYISRVCDTNIASIVISAGDK